MSLSERLESALPPVRLAFLKAVSELASAHHTALYLVGGFVRDLLMDRPSIDFDLVVEGDAITLAHALGRRFGGRITTHTRFGTAKWLIEPISADLANELGFIGGQADLPEFLDLISARTEFYTHPTALPTVERGNIKLDLHRRDFTINTLAMRLDGSHYGELYDYWGGLPDLREKLVRVLHSLSFVDDPTRMLRAVRFEQRFRFCIESRTVELLHEALTLLSRVSGERIRHELDHILDEEDRLLMLNRLAELGLLQAIHPGMTWTDSTNNRMQKLSNVSPEEIRTILSTKYQPAIENRLAYILWFIDLPEEQAAAVLWRMKYPPSMIEEIRAACKLYRVAVSLKEKHASEVVRFLEKYPLLAIYGNYLSIDDESQRLIIWRYLVEWRNVEPTINGDEIRARGLPPGPIYGRILDTLRSAWLDGEISSRGEERLLFEKLLKEYR
jgi:tRNA nucleotidyltransferase (CCA-adding enzyme)